jgi:[ribosomal protein S18]-alanine N-acetyltransferase
LTPGDFSASDQQRTSGLKHTIRNGTREDIPRLLEIAGESSSAAQWSPAQYEHLFAPKVVQESCLLVAQAGGTLVGFLIAQGLDGDWEIENIAVTSHLQRQGVGTELLKKFLDGIRQNAAKAVHLEVRESNRSAQGLYGKAGFVQTGRRKSYYLAPPEDAIVLRFSF